MIDVLVGLDLGGTKSSVLAETPQGRRVVDVTVASRGWDAEPVADGARWVDALLRDQLPAGVDVVAVGIGAQGLDNPEVVTAFTRELAGLGYRATCVNDAELLVPAAGLVAGIGLISGTGAIAVGADAQGVTLIAGGWGWVIGDDAGAAGIVREATKLALHAHDGGTPDDGLLGALSDAFGVGSAERLARAVNDEPTMDNWGPAAPAVFQAAGRGSSLALRVIRHAADHLADLVDQLLHRGAVGTDVVAAGGVITAQPPLFDALQELLRQRHPDLTLHLLQDPPVVGALTLARRLAPPEPPDPRQLPPVPTAARQPYPQE